MTNVLLSRDVAEEARSHPAWLRLKASATAIADVQEADGSVRADAKVQAVPQVEAIVAAIAELAPAFPHDEAYLRQLRNDFCRWREEGFAVPDFTASLEAFHPEADRFDRRGHLVVFPMYTQNGSADRHVEALLISVIWPEFLGELEASRYENPQFVPIRFVDFTAGYQSHSAVLFPETVCAKPQATRFSWGAIFADREAARFRRVVTAAAELTGLDLPDRVESLLADQGRTEETFVLWDLIHDRTHMHGDLPFDPFMIKQRMPYFLYSLEELRCDLTAFREAVQLDGEGVERARDVQVAILFDRIFRFPISGTRVRNYDGLGGQLLFAWLHQRRVLNWTDNRLSVEWDGVVPAVLELGEAIDDLYWRSIDRPKIAHWLAAYQLISGTLTPHPASVWATRELPLDGPLRGLTDAVRDDEFPLSMFYEALRRKLTPVLEATMGITGASAAED